MGGCQQPVPGDRPRHQSKKTVGGMEELALSIKFVICVCMCIGICVCVHMRLHVSVSCCMCVCLCLCPVYMCLFGYIHREDRGHKVSALFLISLDKTCH